MTQNLVALGTIVEKARKIEGLLRELGAQGKGLKELGETLTPPLPSKEQYSLRHVYIVRNKATHEEHFTVSESELRNYHVAADLVIGSLEERLASRAAPAPEPAKPPQSEAPVIRQQQPPAVRRPPVAAKVEAKPTFKQKAKEVAVQAAVWAVVNWIRNR
ncbi:hypothetical protein PQS90_08990 [Pseudomonas sp. BLCC-B13]|uniref:hypothetical protein n=1 Tax=Pseudomonas sp. BLCC-B13 TaxID=3025314 RepID=UPI00234F6A55|nr:hypothetical protein [Pseudomonas sp. BLCC-B13]MDC7825285.1 hypothetical protein [Pseudomonas sp. BLCC-B13]